VLEGIIYKNPNRDRKNDDITKKNKITNIHKLFIVNNHRYSVGVDFYFCLFEKKIELRKIQEMYFIESIISFEPKQNKQK